MNTADYLFPRDLQVSPSGMSKILMIGSCQAEFYVTEFKKFQPGLEVEHILFNNAQTLPPKTREELASYSLQYIQLPLRSVLTDGVLRLARNEQAGTDWLAVGKANIDAMLGQALAYCTIGHLLTMVSNFVVPQGRISPSLADQDTELDMTYVIRELNHHLSSAIKQHTNVYLADIDMIANTVGKKYFLDDTIYFFTHGVALSLDAFVDVEAEHSLPAPSRLEGNLHLVQRYESKLDDYYEALYRQVDATYRAVHQIDAVKLVIFDLDNTLWRGLIGEHYEPGSAWPQLHGWPTGIWDAINQLRRRGIVVSLCSKNDEATVRGKWRYAMPLGLVEFEDFLVPKINWLPKAQNIASIIEELSLTPKNVLFVDDNPVERESVLAAIPEIRVIGTDPFAVKRQLLWSPQTQVARLSAESAGREASLQSKVQRDQQRVAMPRGEFLRSLNSEVELTELRGVDDPDFYRVSELVNKTNQFNTVGTRRSIDDYLRHWDEGGRLFAFSVKDRYSDYGLVGVLFVSGSCITQYVMSCRVLGMEIETAALRAVVGKLREADAALPVAGLIWHTDKNTPSRDVFTTAGFLATDNTQVFVSHGPLPASVGAHVGITWRAAAPAVAVAAPGYADNPFPEHAAPALAHRLRIAFIGNSLTLHEPSAEVGWPHTHGMAAASSHSDYVHKVLAQLELTEDEAYIRNFYPFESDLSVAPGHLQSLRAVFDKLPPVIVIQLGDNISTQEHLNNFSQNLQLLVAAAVGTGGSVYCVSTWWRSEAKDYVIERVCQIYGATYVFIGDLYDHPDNVDRRDVTFAHAGVDMHPKDWGMAQIGARLAKAIAAKAAG